MVMPDVTVLVYAHRTDSEHHPRNAAWLVRTATGDQPFALSELVASGFLRVVTQRRFFQRPSTVDEAMAFLDQLVARPVCRLVRPGPRHFQIFRRLCQAHACTGGLVADAYHAALAMEHGCTWISNDTDFARFEGLEWRMPS